MSSSAKIPSIRSPSALVLSKSGPPSLADCVWSSSFLLSEGWLPSTVNTSYGKNRDSEHPRQSIENRALWLPRPWAVDASKPFKVSQRTSCSVAFLDTLCGRNRIYLCEVTKVLLSLLTSIIMRFKSNLESNYFPAKRDAVFQRSQL